MRVVLAEIAPMLPEGATEVLATTATTLPLARRAQINSRFDDIGTQPFWS